MNLTPQEMAWLLAVLEDIQKKMPGARSREPHYDASSWDFDDLFRAFREQAVWSRDIIWQAVAERISTGVWPKVEPKYSFWLRQRSLLALRYCRAVLEKSNGSDSKTVIASRPNDAQAALKWILLDLWDTRLVDMWIRENARACVSSDWPEEGVEYELEKYFEKMGV
jgi:hypothetical protein